MIKRALEFKNNPIEMVNIIAGSAINGVDIPEETWEEIKEERSNILKVNGEDITRVLDTIYESGDKIKGIRLFFESGMATSLFQHKCVFDEEIEMLAEDIQTREDFFTILCFNNHETFRRVLGGDSKTVKGIKAIGGVFKGIEGLGYDVSNEGKHRLIAFDAMKVSETVKESGIIPKFMQRALQTLDGDKYPTSIKEFPVKGSDLKDMGVKGHEVSDTLNRLLISVMTDRFPMDKDVLLEMVRRDLV